MALTFTIDGSTLSPTPSALEATPPMAVIEQMADGSAQASKRDFGWVVKVTFGVDEAATAVMAALRTARNGLVEHYIGWTDPTGTTWGPISVLWPSDPEMRIANDFHYRAFTITFVEGGDAAP